MVRGYAFLTFDAAARISFWSARAEQILGWTEPEVIGQSGTLIFTPEDRESGEPEKELENAKRDGSTSDERWHLRKDGSRFWASGVMTALRDETGRHTGFAKVLRDLTETKKAQQHRAKVRRLARQLIEQRLHSAGAALDQSKEELRALAAQLMTAQEDERQGIARELHDDLAQGMAVLELELNALSQSLDAPRDARAADLARLREHVGSLGADLQHMSQRLHPTTLETLGLETALQDLVDAFGRHWPAPVDYAVRRLPEHIAPGIATVVYRIVQESLRNVSKHAPGAAVAVLLRGTRGTLKLTIEDRGPGFDPGSVRSRGGLGLVSMGERVRLVGGTLAVSSRPGEGTSITVRIPA